MIFLDRQDAGKKLAQEIQTHHFSDPFVLALPRGGVPVGFEISRALNCPFDVLVSQKIGSPQNPEFGIGAIAENNSIIINHQMLDLLGLNNSDLDDIIQTTQDEIKRRINLYRFGQSLPSLSSNTVIIVDDGLATGVTAQAALESVKKMNPFKVVFAAPVCARETVEDLDVQVDSILCLTTPFDFKAVGIWYQNFSQLSDEEVLSYLNRSS